MHNKINLTPNNQIHLRKNANLNPMNKSPLEPANNPNSSRQNASPCIQRFSNWFQTNHTNKFWLPPFIQRVVLQSLSTTISSDISHSLLNIIEILLKSSATENTLEKWFLPWFFNRRMNIALFSLKIVNFTAIKTTQINRCNTKFT